MDFIDLLEVVVKETKPDFGKFNKPTSLDDTFEESEIGLDSLDMALVTTVMGEIYKVPVKVLDSARNIRTVRELKDFVENNGERIPETLEEAQGFIE
jgi:acyl carrier protein